MNKPEELNKDEFYPNFPSYDDLGCVYQDSEEQYYAECAESLHNSCKDDLYEVENLFEEMLDKRNIEDDELTTYGDANFRLRCKFRQALVSIFEDYLGETRHSLEPRVIEEKKKRDKENKQKRIRFKKQLKNTKPIDLGTENKMTVDLVWGVAKYPTESPLRKLGDAIMGQLERNKTADSSDWLDGKPL